MRVGDLSKHWNTSFTSYLTFATPWRFLIMRFFLRFLSYRETLSVLSSFGTLVGIGLNLLVGGTGDLGLAITGISLGLGLTLLVLLVRAFI
jgi:hypothetical protein